MASLFSTFYFTLLMLTYLLSSWLMDQQERSQKCPADWLYHTLWALHLYRWSKARRSMLSRWAGGWCFQPCLLPCGCAYLRLYNRHWPSHSKTFLLEELLSYLLLCCPFWLKLAYCCFTCSLIALFSHSSGGVVCFSRYKCCFSWRHLQIVCQILTQIIVHFTFIACEVDFFSIHILSYT